MKWWYAVIHGVGECLLETDVDLMNQFDDSEWFEFHKLTMIMIHPGNGQLGFGKHLSSNAKMCNGGGKMRRSALIVVCEARAEAVKDMDRVWSDNPVGGIALPTMEDMRRLNKK